MRQLKIVPRITDRESDSLERYLQEISRVPQVSMDEEVELVRRIRQGDETALERLVCANLRFVVSVAKRYQGQGLGLTDLINEGNVGLMTAARRFDETRGFKFISYAVWWIRQSILLALNEEGRMVRLPQNLREQLAKVRKYSDLFVQQNERQPSVEEIAEGTGIELEKVVTTLQSASRHVSIDAPLVEEEDSCLLDLLHNVEGGGIDERLVSDSLKTEVNLALAALPPRERAVIRYFFGFDGPELRLEEIGDRLNLSRERVRQMKEKAIILLRAAHENTILKDYL